jgi:proteasome lid subunit RPN8/RPN11
MPDANPSGYGRWSAGEGSLAIEYSCALLGDIRVLVVDGLHRLSRGGIEVGGVLYGRRAGESLSIEAQHPIECEHARGPSFTLSENDLAGLEKMLGAAQSAAAGLEPLGWYHSHTRTGICLSEEDLKLYNRFFPHPWQVALVLHPEKLGPVTAGFFFREADGSLRAESSYQEFEVMAVKARAAAAPSAHRVATPVATAAAVSAARTAPPPPPPAPVAPAPERKANLPMPGKTPGRAPAPEQAQHPPQRIMAAAETRTSSDPEKLGAFLKRLEPRRNPRTRWILGALLCLAAFFLGLASRSWWVGRNIPQALSLRAFDQGGQLRVEWDRAAAPIVEAQSGVLEVVDGGQKTLIPLDREHLQSGGISYGRRTADVDVRLKVMGPGGVIAQEVTRFVGPPARPSRGGAR